MELAGLLRFAHIVFGILWVGMLFYFMLVQVPALRAAMADGSAAGIVRHIAPRALLWFRIGSVGTWLAGAALLGPGFVAAFTLQPGMRLIGVGAWLGTIMFLNVWLFIWPAWKKILGLVPADDAAKGRARKTALLAARTNLALSLPMLYCMAAGSHPGQFGVFS